MLQFRTIEDIENSIKTLDKLSKKTDFNFNKRINIYSNLKHKIKEQLSKQFNKGLKVKPLSRDKRNFIGIEFEFYSNKKLLDIYVKCFELKLNGKIKIKSDSSINCRSSFIGREITILTTKYSLLRDLNKLDKLFKWMDAQVNSSCGLHVHIDTRNRNRNKVINNFQKLETLIAKLVNKRRLNNHYCRIAKYRTRERYSWESGSYTTYTPMDDKYQAINTQHRNTVEIRLHEGCLDVKKVYAWVMLLNKIADYNDKIDNEIKDKNNFKKVIKINPTINKYIDTTYVERAI